LATEPLQSQSGRLVPSRRLARSSRAAPLVIRPFVDPADREAVAALYRTTWHATYDSVDGADAIDRVLADQLHGDAPEMFDLASGDAALVASIGDLIVGSARAHPRHDGVHLSGFYILPGYQRRGVGAALFRGLRRLFPRSTIWRASVRPTSAAAKRFYARHGFREIRRSQSDVGGGHLIDAIELERRPVIRPSAIWSGGNWPSAVWPRRAR
jgi:ribosomal protein S18 acetylase RimI-like enzyme